MCGKNGRNRKGTSLINIITLASLSSSIVCLVLVFIISLNVDAIADLDILYTSRNSEFVFLNTSRRVETMKCGDVSDCLNKLVEISERAVNVVSYSSIYNFTENPLDSISHYTRNTMYFSLSFIVISLIFSCVSFFLALKLENTVFLYYSEDDDSE